MQNIRTLSGLKEAISQLEHKKAEQGQLLKEQFNKAWEKLNPFRPVQDTLTKWMSSSVSASSVLGTVIGLMSAYRSGKTVAGSSKSRLKRLLGNVLVLGITEVLARKPELIRVAGQKLWLSVFGNRKTTN